MAARPHTARLGRVRQGRSGSFQGQPAITATIQWSGVGRSLVIAGTRGRERSRRSSSPVGAAPTRPRHVARCVVRRPRRPDARAERERAARGQPADGYCCRCGQPIPAGARPEARYWPKRCRQAGSRAARARTRVRFPTVCVHSLPSLEEPLLLAPFSCRTSFLLVRRAASRSSCASRSCISRSVMRAARRSFVSRRAASSGVWS